MRWLCEDCHYNLHVLVKSKNSRKALQKTTNKFIKKKRKIAQKERQNKINLSRPSRYERAKTLLYNYERSAQSNNMSLFEYLKTRKKIKRKTINYFIELGRTGEFDNKEIMVWLMKQK